MAVKKLNKDFTTLYKRFPALNMIPMISKTSLRWTVKRKLKDGSYIKEKTEAMVA